MEAVECIKLEFTSHGPKFTGSDTMLADACCLLVTKAANHLTITSKHEMNI